MKINIKKEELSKLNKINEDNYKLLKYLHNYLFYYDRCIKKEMIDDLLKYDLDEEYAFYLLLVGLLDLDIEDKEQKYFLDNYLLKSIKKLDKEEYINNPYYKNIKFNNVKINNWTLKKNKYSKYQGFVYDDFIIDKDYKEVVSLGFFNEEFSYLHVLENDLEWMSITPNEINTMKEPINNAKGKVLTFGLGLGYYAYMVSLKEEVESVTIIERDQNVIKLFNEYILPQFEYKDKIKIINIDAFKYMNKVNEYDYLFIDLWRDVSDGLDLYLKFKKYEDKINIKVDYWIEKSILSYLRKEVLDNINKYLDNKENYLNEIDYEINNYDDLIKFLSNENLKELAKKIN